MNFLERIDKNVHPFLAHLWMDLAWFQEFGVSFGDVRS